MNVLIVYAHPEAHSLNGALNAFAISHLENADTTCRYPISTP
jgi:NAD(P)H dehydrogenase (quinone)